MIRRMLFICTGNYYRSRFAEMLFNARAARTGLCWVADSRGIATDSAFGNIGAISTYTIEALQGHGIAVEDPARCPMQLQERDLAAADVIIALDEVEHRPYLERRFPSLACRIEYWHVPDLDRELPGAALSTIEREIDSLIQRLSRRPDTIHPATLA
jgi:protein-tyrosine phosphatase